MNPSLLHCTYRLLLVSAWLVSAQAATAQTIRYVTPTGTSAPASATNSWATSTTDLQGAINASAPGDQVWLKAGLYLPTMTTGPASRTVSFSMKNGVTLYGNFTGTETALTERTLTYPLSTTLSGDIGTPGSIADNSYHVISNPQGLTATAVLDGVLITAGNANGSFPDYDGGGMYNYAFRGVCSPTVRNCAFAGNSASSNVGAVYNYSNQASSYNGITAPTFTNCIFLTNSAGSGGGAAASFGDNSQLMLINCSFGGNTAGYGGALYNPANTRTALINCILFGNGAGAISNTGNGTAVAGYSLFGASVGGYSGVSNLTTTTSPFVLATGNLQLTTCSLAINAGDPATATIAVGTTDLGGNVRVVGRRIDMGAFEMQSGPGVFPVTVADGPWNTGAVWFCERVPMVSDAVQMLHVVSLPDSYVGGAGQVTFGTGGTLRYGTASRFVLGQ